MKRYRFRLDPVLRVRRLQEDLAASSLRAANHAVSEAAELVTVRRTHYAQLPPVKPGHLSDHLASRRRLEQAAAAIDRAVNARGAAEACADEALASWQEATMRVSALEHLDDARRTEHAREVAREEEREVDQVVMGRVCRQRGAGSVTP